MSEYFIVDRIQDENITVEAPNGEMIVISKNNIKELIKESDVLVRAGNTFVVDIKETEDRKYRIKKFMKGMWQE